MNLKSLVLLDFIEDPNESDQSYASNCAKSLQEMIYTYLPLLNSFAVDSLYFSTKTVFNTLEIKKLIEKFDSTLIN